MWHVPPAPQQFQGIRTSDWRQIKKNKPHYFFAHHSLIDDVEKSKLTGLCRRWSGLGEIVQNTADSEQDPYNMWVHQRTPEGVHKFGFRYKAVLPNGEITGLFYADGRIWYQNQITVWYSEKWRFLNHVPIRTRKV